MTRLNLQLNGPDKAINFAQGFPDFATDPRIVESAAKAMRDGFNQYATTWGAPQLRKAIARKQSAAWGRDVDPDTEVTISCGATEAMIAAMLAAVDPGDEVIIFEPFYENYGPDCIISGAVPRYVTLRAPDWAFDPDELRGAFGSRTRAIVVNTPHNPTGKVFSRQELELIAELCVEHDAIAITDEIYEHLVYRGEHISIATLPGMADRTITISGASKTFSVTGWRVGWLIAPASLTAGIRKVHDFLTVGAAHPLQIAVAAALELPAEFYVELLRRLPRTPGRHRHRPSGMRVRRFGSRRRLLRDGRDRGIWFRRRHCDGAAPDREGRCGDGAGVELLSRPQPGKRPPSLQLSQADRDDRTRCASTSRLALLTAWVHASP